MDIIINRKRENFIKEFEENLYKAAIDNKQIKYYKYLQLALYLVSK